MLRRAGLGVLTLTLLIFPIAMIINARQAALFPPPVAIPQTGQTYLGVQLDWGQDSVGGYADRLGRTPAVYGKYVGFPLSSADKTTLDANMDQLASRGAKFMITLEPNGGLDSVNAASLQDLTAQLRAWNAKGVPVIVRFAHEMNGTWYPWAQQPKAYIETFRRVARAVHQAPASAMLWSPNEGGGYPFNGGKYSVKTESADFGRLDTNDDGSLTMSDDPYTPYYPGDSYVDWVGLTLYHFGAVYPWGKNVVPEPGKLVGKLTGTYKNEHMDETAAPNFYQMFAVGHHKPLAISETSAFYNASRTDGASAYDIKTAWMKQLFDPSLATRFPQLKLGMWFEYFKKENDSGGGTVDWRMTDDPDLLKDYSAAIPDRFITASAE